MKIRKHDMDLDAIKPDFFLHAKKGTDQPDHHHSTISTFVIRFLERIRTPLATHKISIF